MIRTSPHKTPEVLKSMKLLLAKTTAYLFDKYSVASFGVVLNLPQNFHPKLFLLARTISTVVASTVLAWGIAVPTCT